MRRFAITLTSILSMLVAAGGAQARVISDGGTLAGVSLVPAARNSALPAGVSAVTAQAPCIDPWLATDLGGPQLPSDGLCYHGGAVMNRNETFAVTWDADRAYWSGTRGYVEQFLRDVADGSGTLSSPYAVTQQYSDGSGRAENASVYGGGCIDYGSVGGSACEFGNPTGAGHDYPANGCTPEGNSFTSTQVISDNRVCLTDAQLQAEVSAMVSQAAMLGRTEPGYTPAVTLLLPAGVETCLDAQDDLCSANGFLTPPPPQASSGNTGGTIAAGTYRVTVMYTTAGGPPVPAPSASQSVTTTGATSTISVSSPPSAVGATGWNAYVTSASGLTFVLQNTTPMAIGANLTLTTLTTSGAGLPPTHAFCSYHSLVDVGGTPVAYVVQPWTAGTSCDEPDAPPIPATPSPQELALDIGIRLVSPLSQSHIAAIVNPRLNGWYALDGSEIDDNGGCVPLPFGLDKVVVGGSPQNPYLLQREFNNAGTIEFDPNTFFGCAPMVMLSPAFVVPSAVNRGDVVEFDGSATASTLMVPRANYSWTFGDGASAQGPSVEHGYAKGGTFTVTLSVTDRGGNSARLSQTIVVLGPNGQHVTPPPPSGGSHGLKARLTLMPQSLRSALHNGVTVAVSANETADGIATLSISKGAASRARIKHGRGATVVIGRGTVSGVKAGTVKLHLHLPRGIAGRLARLHHLTLTVRLTLIAAGGAHVAIDAAGRY